MLLAGSDARDFTYTLQLGAGMSECFYDYIHEGAFLEIEYQVIEGGDLDINFIISDPDRKAIVMEPHSMDGLHAVDIKKTGEYEICLDNTFSRLTKKTVFLDVIIEDDPGEEKEEGGVMPHQLANEAVVMDMKVQQIMKKLDSLGQKLQKMVSTQQFFKARESRHKHTIESNNTRVLWWSVFECSVIVGVGVLQVFVIRSLFKTRRKDRLRT